MITHGKFITILRPYFIRDGRPTALVRKIQETQKGRMLCAALYSYYTSTLEHPDYASWELDTSIDIENYRIELVLVDRLRKAGL